MSDHKGFTLIELMIVVAIIGIVAVVAIPIYSKYQTKTKVTAGLAEVTALKTGFEATINQGAAPTLALAGGSAATSPNCTITMTGSLSTGAGTIACALQNVPTSLAGKSITLNRSPDGDWSCTSTVDDEYRPKGCAAPSEG